MSKPTKPEVKAVLEELREFIESSDDRIAVRVAYEVEHAIRWVTEDTNWPSPLEMAKGGADLIREEQEA